MNLYRILILIIFPIVLLSGHLKAEDTVTALVARGRSEYLAGDSAAAERTFKEVCALDENNAAGEYFLARIEQERDRTRVRMLAEVDQAWHRPEISVVPAQGNPPAAD